MDPRGLEFYINTLKDKYSYRWSWLGRPIIQVPQDIVAIQELIWEVKPDYVIETGVARGGGLVLYASVLECLGGKGLAVGIEVEPREENELALEFHPLANRYIRIKGTSIDPKIPKALARAIEVTGSRGCLVILDSLHTHDHVLQELRLYAPLVSVGSYIIVMDTIIEYLPPDSFPDRPWDIGNNPATAVREFLLSPEGQGFEVDHSIDDRLIITSAPGGYLRRVR